MGQIPLEVGWDDEIDQLWDRVVEAYGEATAIQAMQRAIQTRASPSRSERRQHRRTGSRRIQGRIQG